MNRQQRRAAERRTRKWEFQELIEDDDSISFQKQGKTEDGTQLWALYRHCPEEVL